MEGLKSAFGSAISDDGKVGSSSSGFIQSYLEKVVPNYTPASASSSPPSADHTQLLLTRSPRQVVSLWTCSKLCAICFVAGIVVGYTLKRRVRRLAAKLLRRLKDD